MIKMRPRIVFSDRIIIGNQLRISSLQWLIWSLAPEVIENSTSWVWSHYFLLPLGGSMYAFIQKIKNTFSRNFSQSSKLWDDRECQLKSAEPCEFRGPSEDLSSWGLPSGSSYEEILHSSLSAAPCHLWVISGVLGISLTPLLWGWCVKTFTFFSL